MDFFNDLYFLCRAHPVAAAFCGVLATIGLVRMTLFSLSLSALVLDAFVLPAVDLSKYGARKGGWVVVTAASDGLGKEYALQLAKKGFHLVLVSRTESKLETLVAEIGAKYPKIKTRSLAFDASTDSPENYSRLEKLLSSVEGPVTALINNVGVSHSMPVSFLETAEEEMQTIINVNVNATLKITRVVVPFIKKSVADGAAKRGLILTMSSFGGGLVPTPLLATYSGSKSFLQAWSMSLAQELVADKIDVQLVLAHLVVSAMSKVRRPNVLVPMPKPFVASVIKSIGRRVGAQERYATMSPYWSHALYHFVIDQSVGVYSWLTLSINHSQHKDIRRRALRKRDREAKKKEQ